MTTSDGFRELSPTSCESNVGRRATLWVLDFVPAAASVRHGKEMAGRTSRKPLMLTALFLATIAGCTTTQGSAPTVPPSDTPPPPVHLTTAKVQPTSAHAQPPVASTEASAHRIAINGMSVADAIGIAIARHPDISRANAAITQGASEVAVAKAAWYPTVEYGVRPGYGQAYGNLNQEARLIGTVGVNQLVYDFGRTSSQISAAEATLSKHRYMHDDTVANVAYNTATAFIEFAASQDLVGAARSQVTALTEVRARIGERVKAGLSDVSDQYQAEVAIQRAEADVLKAKTRLDVAAGRLAELVGVRPQRIALLSNTATFVSRLQRSGGDVEQTPAVQAANAALEAATAKVGVAKAERWPSIGVGFNRSLSTGSMSVNDNTYIGATISGSFSLGGLARHKIASAEAERSAAAHTLENQRLVTRTAVHSAETEATGADARMAGYEKVITITRSSRDLSWQQYTLNKRPLTDVLNTEHEIYLAEVERTTAVADGVMARVKAFTAVGQFTTLLRVQVKGRN